MGQTQPNDPSWLQPYLTTTEQLIALQKILASKLDMR